MKHLKLFQTEAEYTAYKNGGRFILPNVSCVVDALNIFYNSDNKINSEIIFATVAKGTNTENDRRLAIGNTSNIKSLKVDGNIIPTDRKITYINNSEVQLNFQEESTTIICPDDYFMNPDDLKYIKFMINAERHDDKGTYDKLQYADAYIFFKNDSSQEGILINSLNAHDILIDSYKDETLYNIDMVALKEEFSNIPEGELPPNTKICILFSLNDEIVNCSRYYYGINDELPLTEGYFFEDFDEHTLEIELLDNSRIIGARYNYGPVGDTMFYSGGYISCINTIQLPDSIKTIEGLAFGSMTDLTSINIPNSVTYIGAQVFVGCEKLTSINIPDSVTFIGNDAFSGCSGLSELICNANTAPELGGIYVFRNISSKGVLKVPAGSDYSSWMNYLNEYNWTIEYL